MVAPEVSFDFATVMNFRTLVSTLHRCQCFAFLSAIALFFGSDAPRGLFGGSKPSFF